MVTVTSENLQPSSLFPLVPCCSQTESVEKIRIGCIIMATIKSKIQWTPNNNAAQHHVPIVDSPDIQASFLPISFQDWKNKSYTCSIEGDNKKEQHLRRSCDERSADPIVETLISSCATENIVPLTCLVTNFRPQVTRLLWLKNGITDDTNAGFSPELEKADFVKNIKKVSSESWNKEDIYTCQVTSKDISVFSNISKCSACQSIFGDPVVTVDQPTNEELFSNQGKITCTVIGSKSDIKNVFLKINNNIVHTEDNKMPDDKHSNIVKITHKITLEQWESTRELSCGVTMLCSGKATEKTIKIEKKTEPKDFKIPLVSVSRLYHYEFQEEGWMTLICKVSRFYPEEISIKWENKNQEVNTSSYTRSPVSCSGKYCSAFSLLRVSVKDEIGGYQCVIQHKSPKQPNQRIFKKLSATQREPSVLVLESPDSEEKKTLVCIADGHFPKEIKVEWKRHNESLDSSYNETEYKNNGTYRTVFSIEVSKEDWAKGHNYTCEVSHKSISANIVKTINALDSLVDMTARVSCLTNAINPSIKWILDEKSRSQNDSKEQIIHNNRTWFKSTVSIGLAAWNANSSFSCMLDLPQELPQNQLNVMKTYNTTRPTDTPLVYQDDGGEELNDTEETSSVWTTSTTFIVLFLITIVYSSCVTFVKVK